MLLHISGPCRSFCKRQIGKNKTITNKKLLCWDAYQSIMETINDYLFQKEIITALLWCVMPAITIIVPVYNCASYLPRCLDSLLEQTFHDWEAICIDDGSTDDSAKILKTYAERDARVRVLRQANAGLSAARNAGLAQAQANLIMFCDSDDWYAPTMCEKMYSAMQDDAELAVCGVQEKFEGLKKRKTASLFELPWTGKMPVTDKLLWRCNVCVWNKMFRKEIIERERLQFPEGLLFEDEYFFAIYSAYVHQVIFLPERLYFYRRRPSSITGRLAGGGEALRQCAEQRARIANSIWIYHEQRDLTKKRLSYLAHTWLRLYAGVLCLSEDEKQLFEMEENALNFARAHIEPLSRDLPSVSRQRLTLLSEHRWIGTRFKWGGLLRCRSADRMRPDAGAVMTRKYYLLGIPCWKCWEKYTISALS